MAEGFREESAANAAEFANNPAGAASNPAGAASIPAVPPSPGGRQALIGRRIFPSPLARRISYAIIFEIFAVIFTAIIFALLGNSAGDSVLASVASSTAALAWNLVFNWLFEAFERRIGITDRPWYMRVAHALTFEAGIIVLLVPLISLILGIGLVQAFFTQFGLMIFFLIYTAIFAWVFDRVFGLPEPAEHYRA